MAQPMTDNQPTRPPHDERSPGDALADAEAGTLLADRLEIDPTAWVAPDAVLLGDVRLDAHASVWPGTVLRGDLAPIEIGRRTNLQDGVIVHTDPGYPVKVGCGVTVGHRAVVHAATVEDDCLIGIGSLVLTGARVGAGSLVGAGAVVTEGAQVPPGSVVLGVPGRVIRTVDPELRKRILGSAVRYVEYARQYREGR